MASSALTALVSVILPRARLKELLLEVEEDMPYIFCSLKRFPYDLEARTDSSIEKFPKISLQEILDGAFSHHDGLRRGGR
jgi:hypothetical protein